jgi:chitodextrinase
MQYARGFFVGSPDASRIASVSLVRLGSVTHAFDENQRFVPLAFQSTIGGLTIQAPASANVAPLGDYMLFIVDTNGVPSVAPMVRLTNTAPDVQPPIAPTALGATAISPSQINLTWNASTDNVGVASYFVERCAGAGCNNFVHIGTTTATTYNDSGLTAGTTYGYRVRALDSANNLSGYSNVASATTPDPDTQPPTAPSALALTAPTFGQLNLTWNASTDNFGVTNYLIERCQGAGCGTFTQIATSTTTAYSDGGLAPNTTYGYRVRATDAANNPSGYSNVASATTQAAPSGLVGAYGFNEGLGTTTADASGRSHPGTLVGATWTNAGRYGKALSYNGTSSYVDLGNPTDFQITGSMSWSAWIFATANPVDDGQIVSKSSGPGWQFKSSPDTGPHTFGVAVSANGTSNVQRYSNTVRQLNTWYHVAGVYDATARTLNIYVNGVLDNGVLRGTVPASQWNAPQNVNLGRRTGGFYFAGTIDEVRLYNRALSQGEIQADMNTPIGAP